MEVLLWLMVSLGSAALLLQRPPPSRTRAVRRARLMYGHRWQQQANLHSYQDRLIGRWQGRWVWIAFAPGADLNDPPSMTLRVAIHAALPDDLEVLVNRRLVPVDATFFRPDAPRSGRWAMGNRQHERLLRSLFQDDALLSALADFLERRRGRLRARELIGRWSQLPDDIRPVLDEMTRLAARIESAWEHPRRMLADALGLTFASCDAEGRWQLSGSIEDIDLRLRFSSTSLELHAVLPGPPPAQFLTRAVRGSRTEGARSGNPLLDSLLYIRAPTPRLHDPDLAGALLAVLHAHPGATLAGSTLYVPHPPTETLETVRALLDRVVQLSTAMKPSP